MASPHPRQWASQAHSTHLLQCKLMGWKSRGTAALGAAPHPCLTVPKSLEGAEITSALSCTWVPQDRAASTPLTKRRPFLHSSWQQAGGRGGGYCARSADEESVDWSQLDRDKVANCPGQTGTNWHTHMQARIP